MSKEKLEYNTAAPKLRLPEYGRIIQSMVEDCMSIADREERLACAEYIVRRMAKQAKVNPNDPSAMKLLWDHLYFMSGFSLDIDYPYELSTEEDMSLDPQTIPYSKKAPRYWQYGHAIEKMIEISLDTEDPELRRQREILTATQMKKAYVEWNKAEVTDEKIFKDLYDMSETQIYLDEFNCVLPDVKLSTETDNNNKKKKKKKR